MGGEPSQGRRLSAHLRQPEPATPRQKLVTLSDDGKLRLWDVASRKLIGAPLPAANSGGSVHFFPDGKHVLGVFGSGTGIVWSVEPAAWAAKACSIAHRTLTPGGGPCSSVTAVSQRVSVADTGRARRETNGEDSGCLLGYPPAEPP
jgi:WD40 repeat protein